MPKRRGIYVLVLGLFMVAITKLSAKRFIQFIEEPKDVVALRNQPAELRCNVSGVKNIKVSWIKDGKILDVTNDSRRTIQPHGSLLFSTIVRQKRNSPDDGVYQCVAETIVDSWTYKMVSQKATLTVAGMSKSFAESPSDLTVNKGETAIFRCQLKRSRPPIKITWSMAGKNTDLTLNFRFRVLPSGILEIQSVMASDAGRYVCKASNEKTGKFLTATAVLTVNPASVAPKAIRFLVKPKNAKSLHDKDVILECIVAGYPMPQVTWYKDGQQISPASSKRYTLYGTNNLQISSVQPVDSGKYECAIGSLKAEAYIQVFVPPQFINVPRDTTVLEDDAMTMQCDVIGHPTPTISWYYNGLPVPDADYVKITNNSLTYTEVIEDDRGIYQCFASNEGGEIMASAQLKVLVDVMTTTPYPTTPTTSSIPTTALELTPSPPKKVLVKKLSPTSVNVSWQAPDNPHGTIIRYTVLITRKGAGDLKMFVSTSMFYMVDNLIPSTVYGCSVYATNQNKRFKNGLPSHEVKFQTMALPTPPASNMPPPRDVKVQALTSMALKVSWKPPAVIAFPIQNYTVEYQDMDSNTRVRSASAMKLEIALLKLIPYTHYSIRVTAQTKNGPGQTSTAVVGRTKSGKPKGPPESVQLGLFKAVLLAQWQPPSQPNGNITKYLLKLKNINKGTVSTFNTQDTQKSFLNLEKSTTYAFRVAAVTEAGRGEFSKWIKKDMALKATTENVVPGMPSNLRAHVRLGMIEVTWDPPLESHIIVRHYILSYGEGAPGQNYQQLPENTTSHLLGNLRPSATIIIQVRAANKMGQGQPTLEKVIMPGPNQGNPPLSDLRAVATKKRALKLSWSDPQPPKHGTTYQIKFEKDNLFIYVNTSRQTHLVQDLKAGTMYKFFIKRNKQQDYQTVSNSTIDEKPGPPKDVTVLLDAEVLFMKIQWNSPDEPNGEITDYDICWRPKTESQGTCKNVKGHELNNRISGIKGNITYTVVIRARNSAGEGKPSEPVIFARNIAKKPILTLTGQDSVKTLLPYASTKVLPSVAIKVAKTGDGASLTSDEKTLWIIIAVIAAITLIAIVVISVFLCKKRSRASYVSRKKPAADPYKAVANGGAKKKGTKENYWIKQNAMELEPCETNNKRQDLSVAPTIPRNADEMKPLDSPFQSRKDHNSLLAAESDQESLPPNDDDRHSPSSFSGDNPSRLDEPYQPLPKVAPKPKSLNIYNSPFPHNADGFPSPPQESLDNYDEGPTTSSDYGSEELVASDSNQPPVSYMPQKTPNGYMSVATDFDYPVKERGSNDLDSSALQSLMKDLDAIMSKEDRV